MASLPPRPASRRRSSPETSSDTPSPPSQPARSSSRPRSTISEDSQTVLLNNPSSTQPLKTETPQTTKAPPLQRSDTDVKKCWICFADETEDTPESSEWRSPCPCALVAHEDCLLDWIADMESPSSRKRTLTSPQILCPQCKTEIRLARPRDLLVEAVMATQSISARVVTPAALTVAMSSVFHACQLHGIHSIYMIFGREDGWRILQPLLDPQRWLVESWSIWSAAEDALQHWRLRIGLPLITPMLVLSRTRFADSLLPVLPIVFFATQGDSDQPLDLAHWPPSASLTMAVLPYLRGIYNAYYQRVWAAHEKRWLKEIQPRNGQTSEDQNNGGQNQGNGEDAGDEDDDAAFEIRLEANIWDDWGDGGQDNHQGQADIQQNRRQEEDRMEAEREAIRQDILGDGGGLLVPAAGADAEQAHPFDAPPLADNEAAAAPAPDVPRQRPEAQPQPARQPAVRERRLPFTASGLAEKVLGALLFPSIAALSGEALRYILPAAWTRPAAASVLGARPRTTGLLQERWGRSVVGGCLFVVVKDAIMLYVRWKMAQQHLRRRVLDFDRKKGRGVRK